MPAAKQPSGFILFHQNKTLCWDNLVFSQDIPHMQGEETELKALSWSMSTEMSMAVFFSRVPAHIYYSHLQYWWPRTALAAHASSCPSPDLRSWKTLAFFFYCCFLFQQGAKCPVLMPVYFPKWKRKRTKNNKSSIGIRAGHCLQQRPGLRVIVLAVGSKSGEGEYVLISGFYYAGASSF